MIGVKDCMRLDVYGLVSMNKWLIHVMNDEVSDGVESGEDYVVNVEMKVEGEEEGRSKRVGNTVRFV